MTDAMSREESERKKKAAAEERKKAVATLSKPPFNMADYNPSHLLEVTSNEPLVIAIKKLQSRIDDQEKKIESLMTKVDQLLEINKLNTIK